MNKAKLLEHLADFNVLINALPDGINSYTWISAQELNIWADNLEEARKVLAAVSITMEKRNLNDQIWLVGQAGSVSLRIILDKGEKTGCKRIEKTRIVPAQEALPEREETYYEWECPDFLFKNQK